MANVYLYGRRVSTFFQLLPSLGTYEDDMSRAVGWVLSRCPAVLRGFVKEVTDRRVTTTDARVYFQQIEPKKGRTDVELKIEGDIHFIVEAKRGWQLPEDAQLMQYAKRLRNSDAAIRKIVVLTDCSDEYVRAKARRASLLDIPIVNLSWARFCQIASTSKPDCTPTQRSLIDEALTYLKELITMQQADSNWVFVVSLSSERPKKWKTSWIDVVRVQKRYFHPFGGNGWPVTPPNYLAFRYRGELQSIHRVEDYTLVDDIHDAIREIPRGELTGRHIVYRLGPGFRPDHPVPTGNIFRGGRRSCMLDTLFTAKTIADASRISHKRQKAAPEFAN